MWTSSKLSSGVVVDTRRATTITPVLVVRGWACSTTTLCAEQRYFKDGTRICLTHGTNSFAFARRINLVYASYHCLASTGQY